MKTVRNTLYYAMKWQYAYLTVIFAFYSVKKLQKLINFCLSMFENTLLRNSFFRHEKRQCLDLDTFGVLLFIFFPGEKRTEWRKIVSHPPQIQFPSNRAHLKVNYFDFAEKDISAVDLKPCLIMGINWKTGKHLSLNFSSPSFLPRWYINGDIQTQWGLMRVSQQLSSIEVENLRWRRTWVLEFEHPLLVFLG